MKSLARDGYEKEAVMAALQFAHGVREVDFRYDLLDRFDRRIGSLTAVTGAIVYDSTAQIKGCARLQFSSHEKENIDFLNDRIKPFFRLKMPDGGYCEWPLGIFLMSSPKKQHDGKTQWRDVAAYDKTLILEQDKFEYRYVIPKGANYINAAIRIISEAGVEQVDIPANNASLNVDKEFDPNTGKIAAVNELLQTVNYSSLYFDENGVAKADPYVAPQKRSVGYYYTGEGHSVTLVGGDETEDYFDTPNVFVATSTNPDLDTPLSATFTNDSPSSVVSTVNRGRRIVAYYELSDTADQATLQEYVRRKAHEASQVYNKIVFETALMPHHGFNDTLYVQHPVLSMPGVFHETRWEMPLAVGGVMKHEARRLVTL